MLKVKSQREKAPHRCRHFGFVDNCPNKYSKNYESLQEGKVRSRRMNNIQRNCTGNDDCANMGKLI